METGICKKIHPKITVEKHKQEIEETQDFSPILFDDVVAKVNQLKKDFEISIRNLVEVRTESWS